jgi:hypothetical protein
VHLASLEHDRLVERPVVPAGGFANEDAQKEGFLGYFHGWVGRARFPSMAGDSALASPALDERRARFGFGPQ